MLIEKHYGTYYFVLNRFKFSVFDFSNEKYDNGGMMFRSLHSTAIFKHFTTFLNYWRKIVLLIAMIWCNSIDSIIIHESDRNILV